MEFLSLNHPCLISTSPPYLHIPFKKVSQIQVSALRGEALNFKTDGAKKT